MKAQRTKDDFGMTNSISGSGYVDLNANVLSLQTAGHSANALFSAIVRVAP